MSACESQEEARRDYSRYRSYDTSDDEIVVYDKLEQTAWIKIDQEIAVETDEIV